MNLLMDMRYACDTFPGIGRMSTALCHALAQHPRITRLTIVSNPRQTNSRLHLPAPSAHVHHISVAAPPFSLREAWGMARIIAAQRPDWVYTPYLRLPLAPLQRNLMVTVHDAIPFTTPAPWWVRLGLRAAWVDTALRATIITTVSSAAAHDITHQFWPSRSLHVVPNGIDPRFFTPAPALDLQALGIGGTYDLCVSSNQPHKNLHTLIEAWARAYQDTPPSVARQLVIAGQFDVHRPQPWQDAAYRQLPIVVLASPSDATLHALYQHAALFIYPSLAEGFGLTIAEAMASGCAIICHDHPAMRALVADSAWVIDMHDSHLLSRTIQEAWTNDQQRQHYAHTGQLRAHQFQWAHAADAYVTLMQQYAHT